MSGLEKIVERILSEAAEKAEGILGEARDRADAIGRDAARRTREECEAIEKKAEATAAAILERGRASAALRQKQILLSGRQEVLSETIEGARCELRNLPAEEYAETLKKLLAKHISGGEAVLRLSASDRGKLSEDTLNELSAIAKDAGCSLTIADEPADIPSGFVLDYGGIEENCTFDALIDQSIDELTDRAGAILFK